MRIVAGILVIVAALSAGCGQKGPLYLPTPPRAPQSTAPVGTPTDSTPTVTTPTDTSPTDSRKPADRPYPDVPATTEKQ